MFGSKKKGSSNFDCVVVFVYYLVLIGLQLNRTVFEGHCTCMCCVKCMVNISCRDSGKTTCYRFLGRLCLLLSSRLDTTQIVYCPWILFRKYYFAVECSAILGLLLSTSSWRWKFPIFVLEIAGWPVLVVWTVFVRVCMWTDRKQDGCQSLFVGHSESSSEKSAPSDLWWWYIWRYLSCLVLACKCPVLLLFVDIFGRRKKRLISISSTSLKRTAIFWDICANSNTWIPIQVPWNRQRKK